MLKAPQLARNPAFKLSDTHDMTKDEIRERTMEKVRSRHIGRIPCESTLSADRQFASMVYYVTTEELDVFYLRLEVSLLSWPDCACRVTRLTWVAYRHGRSRFLDPVWRQLWPVPRRAPIRSDP